MPKTTYAMRDPETWQQIMDELDPGGQSQRAYCQAQNIALRTFSKWRWRLRANKSAERPESEPPMFVQLPVK